MGEAFRIWDRTEQQWIPVSEFHCLWRSIGQNPTDTELEELRAEIDPGGIGSFDLEKFLRLCASENPRRFKDPVREEELIEAFRTFDTDGKGVISAPKLRYMLHCLGDALDEAELDAFMEIADKDKSGEVNYMDLVTDLMESDQKY